MDNIDMQVMFRDRVLLNVNTCSRLCTGLLYSYSASAYSNVPLSYTVRYLWR
jgi:hypothetical protein